ncbi:hypothetical protein Q8F55_002046 [Vanrija albida]|uniref:N-acetyltransferase domain-containing protein n=1 Tax=Vanrija albida TaxID=181172 RepID=A0ABR3Q8T2_9TREE
MSTAAPAPVPDAAPDGVIRLYSAKDRAILNQIIGQGFMESLGKANNRVYLHPLVLSAVVALAAVIDYAVGYLPRPGVPGSSLAPLIGFAMVALPLLGAVEWAHRGPFTARLRSVIGARDLVTAAQYYASPSRFYVFEHRGEVRGALALDAAHAGVAVPSVLGDEEGEVAEDKALLRRKGEKKEQEATRLAEIRHLDIDAPVRRKGVATELVATALDHAFGVAGLHADSPAAKPGSIAKVVVLTSPFTPGGDAFWQKLGFAPVPAAESAGWRVDAPLGLLKQSGHWLAIDAPTWARTREALAPPPAPAND